MPADTYQLPAEGKLAFGIVGTGQPYFQARLGETRHGAGIGDVGGYPFPGFKLDIAEESFIAPDQATPQEGSGEFHDPEGNAFAG